MKREIMKKKYEEYERKLRDYDYEVPEFPNTSNAFLLHIVLGATRKTQILRRSIERPNRPSTESARVSSGTSARKHCFTDMSGKWESTGDASKVFEFLPQKM
ncbi:hypothetical protein HPP92_011607 [Vanilla planifolia]|uniref:Uncharacterized protein n=1 Tax=Vanilla planifolia TaxID=51239 RepID=A0A835QYH4_VANPL|nr:hypothetical protein HPP92_011897 [Vanilla planifolia]KAG0483523.1 hypothetical protein HPP92_011607 [Vanilla planifolia]